MKSVRISEICGRLFRNLYFENKQAGIRAIVNKNTALNALIISIFSFEMAISETYVSETRRNILYYPFGDRGHYEGGTLWLSHKA